jgi:hypothetical protein
MYFVVGRLLLAIVLLLAGAADRPIAQTSPHNSQGAPAAKSRNKSPPPAPFQISSEQTLYLIRSTLLTLNDANRSGNYTVLRDLAAPAFQARNSSADLSILFADLRRRNIDLYAVAVMAPQLTASPILDEQKMLHIDGLFATSPMQIKFNLIFENNANQWRLIAISVQTPQAVAQQPMPPATPAQPR